MPPQGRLMIDKPERYDPYRLPGRVDFLYDGKSVSAQETVRGIVDEEKGRVLVRDRQRERELAASLAPRGVRPMEGWQAEKYSIWIPSQKLPEAVEALVAEGWIVEAQGYYRPPCGRMADERHLGRRLVRPGRHARLRRHAGPSARDPGSPPPRPELRAAEGRLAGPLAAGMAQALRLDGRTGRGGRRGDPLSLLAGPAAWTPCWRPRSKSPSMPPSQNSARTCASFNGVGPVDEPPGFCGELRAYQKTGLGWLHFLQDFRLGGCLADDMGLGKTIQVLAMLQERRTRPADGNGRRAAFAGRGAQEPRVQLDRGGQAVHARVAGAGLHRPAARLP